MRHQQAAQHLADVLDTAEQLDAVKARQLDAVARARAAGASWAEIGGAAGLTKQAAQQRWGKLTPAPGPAAVSPITADYLAAAHARINAAASPSPAAPAVDEFGTVALELDAEPPAPAHQLVHLGGSLPTRVEPRTGTGPATCPACGRGNHKAAGYFHAAEVTPACSPTKYDTRSITDYLTGKVPPYTPPTSAFTAAQAGRKTA